MKIKITKGFCLGAGRDVQPGDVVEVSDKDAERLVQSGRAKFYIDISNAKTEPKPRKGAKDET